MIFITAQLMSCRVYKEVKHEFDPNATPAAPEYSSLSNWASLPFQKDHADDVPLVTLVNNQALAKVDVFYVHPTTFKGKESWNASVENQAVNEDTDGRPIKHQASIFNESCRIYAPRYRQANIYSFYDPGDNGLKALDVAYEDVRKSFQYYLDHYNQGRPFVLAAHSQGSRHAIKLLMEYEDQKEVMDLFVVAYLAGMPIFEKYFNHLNPCSTPSQTGCYTNWATYVDNYYPDNYKNLYQGAVCTNPLSWSIDTSYVYFDQHLGLVTAKFDEVVTKSFGAKVHDGILWIDKPYIPGNNLIVNFVKDWHVGDFNLFYMNIRENVKKRIEAYFD